jgi:hypothetical protein
MTNGQAQVRDLGKLNRNGRSLRETIDDLVRNVRKNENYPARKAAFGNPAGVGSAIAESSVARAKSLRDFIGGL